MDVFSLEEHHRLKYRPRLPILLENLTHVDPIYRPSTLAESSSLYELFPKTSHQPLIYFEKGEVHSFNPLQVGILFSGGPAPGGNNVISGLFDALNKCHSQSRVIGICYGLDGMLKNQTIEITAELLSLYRNQGGFDLIGSSRTKLETTEQFLAVEKTARNLNLDGLVIVGGDDSNTNAAFLAEYFKNQNVKTKVIGVPKTIDRDLKNEFIEISFGFDTACKVYSEMIGNLLKDCLSTKKTYFFIRLMGRFASHITLECALQTHPNMALIGEEIAENKQTLSQVVDQIADMICLRADLGNNYGAILISEGIIEFIPEFKRMIQELNHLLALDKKIASFKEKKEKIDYIASQISHEARHLLLELPEYIQEQLILDRDPHGNIQISKIETERLLIALVEKELSRRKEKGAYKGQFNPQSVFYGYEGRSSLPSNFDCKYCYALGHLAALLLHIGATGYMCCIKNLTEPTIQWEIVGVPLFNMLGLEIREGKEKAVIQKTFVDLKGTPFQIFKQESENWLKNDRYSCPGPIEFNGPHDIIERVPLTLLYETKDQRAILC